MNRLPRRPSGSWWAGRSVRARYWVLGAIVIAIVVGAVAVVPGLWRGGLAGGSASGSARLGGGSADDASWPSVALQVVPDSAVALPTDRAIGEGRFIYSVNNNAYLVTADGSQFRVSRTSLDSQQLSLSPNGHWLLDHQTLRELTGTKTIHLATPVSFRAWSPNGHWLLSRPTSVPSPEPSRQYLVDLVTGQSTEVHIRKDAAEPLGPSLDVFAVLDDGTVVATPRYGEGEDPGPPDVATFDVFDPASGALVRTVTVDASKFLPGEESVKGRLGVMRAVAGPGNRVLLQTGGDAHSRSLAIVASLDDGRTLYRIDAQPEGDWFAFGFFSGGVLVKGDNLPAAGRYAGKTVVAVASPQGDVAVGFVLPQRVGLLPDGATAPA